jgi:hypothetical protein
MAEAVEWRGFGLPSRYFRCDATAPGVGWLLDLVDPKLVLIGCSEGVPELGTTNGDGHFARQFVLAQSRDSSTSATLPE